MVIAGVAAAAALMFVVLYWWSEGIYETSDAVLLAVILCGLAFGLFAAREVWQFLLAFVPLAGAGAYAIYSLRFGSSRVYYRRSAEGYIRAIQADPRNLGARECLADAYYNLGYNGRAIDELQAAVDLGAGIESQYKLAKWAKERYLRETTNPVCRWCQTENTQGARQCVKCGADLPYDNSFTRWLVGGGFSSARCYLILIAGVALVSVSLVFLPLTLAFIPLVGCVLALIGWALISSARS